MIIDIHTHYGVIANGYQMPLGMQLHAMDHYGIDYALISNIECGIYHEGIDGNRKMLEMVRSNRSRLGCMLWGCENLGEAQKREFESLYCDHRDIVKGIKLHPDLAGRRADSSCFDFFYQMGERYDLPVLLHTKKGPYSSIEYVVNAARVHPKTRFILGHMGLGSDGSEALAAIERYENIYGDTAWVPADVVVKVEQMGVSHKIMFGTDSPISGEDCYADACYTDYFAHRMDGFNGILADNAKRVFGL